MNRRRFLTTSAAFTLLSACQKADVPIRLALNWKPDPEFGGFYAADYAERGLKVDILPGGTGTPTVQMIGAGSAEYGIVSADELLIARARGNKVVALFAAFQDCPQGIMVHEERGLASIGDVFSGGTVALQSGLPYARLLQKKYGFDKVKIVPSPGGDVTAFLADPAFAQQCFVSAEPLQARKRGAKVKVFPVADAGYNPYTTVLATSEEHLAAKESEARALVDCIREGWKNYLADPEKTNPKMQALNPAMDAETFRAVAEAQNSYVVGRVPGVRLGSMTAERWSQLAQQLQELGDIPNAPKPEECFRML